MATKWDQDSADKNAEVDAAMYLPNQSVSDCNAGVRAGQKRFGTAEMEGVEGVSSRTAAIGRLELAGVMLREKAVPVVYGGNLGFGGLGGSMSACPQNAETRWFLRH